MADGDPVVERQLRKMDILSFLHRILVLQKRQQSQSNELTEKFGRSAE